MTDSSSRPYAILLKLSGVAVIPVSEEKLSCLVVGSENIRFCIREQAKHFYSLLCPESPRCVYEATRFTVSVDYKNIDCPILALGAEQDFLVPSS
jgi:hypothetical protein